jgi:hypothetical protein
VKATAALLLAALLPPLLSGCLDPYRVRVGDDALSRNGLAWTRSDRDPASSGTFGTTTVETDYDFAPSSTPPYPGHLQLFGLREGARRPTDEILALTRAAVENATAANHIQTDGTTQSGTRTLRDGVVTSWFTLEGTVGSGGGLFPQSTKVRILGETGYDGLSSTQVIAVGLAQVESTVCPPLIGACQTRTDLRTWTALVGDTEGSVGGAVDANGLVDNLVSHD